ncbi:TetR/AcrR family transcriptional regulator [Micromonospora zhanjiangensis]|uniref:TetR/AcrR family transcriptional regulator n=1 Tax=Micromonospora zhanjiangensis TaxID=1522057 RepID=A0ABV8KQR1_9ACTN
MVVYAGQGDPRRSMALLWRTGKADDGPTPGPRPALSVDLIVEAALAVADVEGMAALSMRAVGDRLGRTAMALYTYVPGKAELIDLMYDRVLAELPTDYDLDAGWRAAVTAWAEDFWALCLRHPWLLQVSHARPVLGPNEYVMTETLVRIVHRTGLAGPLLWRVVGTLLNFVRGAAGTVAEARQARAVTGVSDDQWWQARSAMLDEMAPDFADRFPMLTRLAGERAFEMADPDTPYLEQEARETFEVGLALLLDGIETTLIRAIQPSPHPSGGGNGVSGGGGRT